MRVNDESDQMPFRAALMTMPPEDPKQVADLALMLYHRTDFKLTVLGYNPRSFFSLYFRDSITGLSMPGFAVDQFIKYGRGVIQTHCRAIWELLADVLSKDNRLEINYIAGRPHTIINTLVPMFDLFIVPHSFKPPSISQHVFADVDSQLIQAKKIPVFFCAVSQKWQRLIVMEIDDDKRYEDNAVLNYLQKFLGEDVLRKDPEATSTMTLQSDSPIEKLPLSKCKEALEAHKTEAGKQTDTVFVVSAKAVCSVVRHRWLKDILHNLQGSILVFPP